MKSNEAMLAIVESALSMLEAELPSREQIIERAIQMREQRLATLQGLRDNLEALRRETLGPRDERVGRLLGQLTALIERDVAAHDVNRRGPR